MLKDRCGRLAATLATCLAALGVVGPAHAAGPAMDSSGTVCRPIGESSQPGLSMTVVGLYVTAPAGMGVLCPMLRSAQPTVTGGMNVWIDFQLPVNTTINCTLFSVAEDGSIMGTASRSNPGDGTPNDMNIFIPTSQMMYLSSANLYCTLPHGAWLFDVEPQII